MNANQWDAIRQLDENDSPVELAAAIGELLDEYDRLATRRDELLATIARISQSTPLDSEVAEALEQRGKLLAEIGTLRAEVSRLAHALDDALHPLHVEERPVRTELRLAKAELAQLRTHVAHNDEEYKVMKDVLRAEHAALQNFRALSVGVTGADASDTIGEIKVHYADGSTMYLADAFERAAGPDPVPYDLASLEEAAHRSRADLLDAQAELAAARAIVEAAKAWRVDTYCDCGCGDQMERDEKPLIAAIPAATSCA